MSTAKGSSKTETKRRSLILAGGGIKVAFQAGVLQVWLDEAGLTFDHADGASGGVFNLAMYCQGMTGIEIADNWRHLRPSRGMQVNWKALLRGPWARSLFKLDRYRDNVFSDWGLNWDAIRATERPATFNAYNFTRHELIVRTADQIDADFVIAAVSLPMWFPPVTIAGDTYIDSVYISDANLEEAILRGADELWIIWTVSQKPRWRDGFIANYFQVIETAANGHFKRVLDRIDKSNRAIGQGGSGEFGRHVEVKLLQAEVPLHYLINFSGTRMAEAVNQGVRVARQWCHDRGIELRSQQHYPADPTSVRFTEEMKGFVEFGEVSYPHGDARGRASETSLMFHLTIDIQGINRFITDPQHEATATGWIRCDALGGRLPVEGSFNLFVQQDEPATQRMLYRLFFHDSAGHKLTLSGIKEVHNDPDADLWSDTTTLYVRLLKGHVPVAEGNEIQVVAAGILRLGPLDLAKQLTTFRTSGPTIGDRMDALRRFGQLFLGKLWDVYAQDVLSSAPF